MRMQSFNGMNVGDTVQVLREYPNETSPRDGKLGKLIEISDDEHARYPFTVYIEEVGYDDTYHLVVPVIEKGASLPGKDLLEILETANASPSLTLRLIALLRKNNIDVSF